MSHITSLRRGLLVSVGLSILLLTPTSALSPTPPPTEPPPTEPPPTASPDVTASPSPLGQDDDAYERALDWIGGRAALESMPGLVVESQGSTYVRDQGRLPGDRTLTEIPFSSTLTVGPGGDVAHEKAAYLRPRHEVPHTVTEVTTDRSGYVSGLDDQRLGPEPRVLSYDRVGATKVHHLLLNPPLLMLETFDGPTNVTLGAAREHEGGTTQLVGIEGSWADWGPGNRDEVGTYTIGLQVDTASGEIRGASSIQQDPIRGFTVIDAQYGDWQRTEEGIRYPGSVTLSTAGDRVHEESRTAATAIPPDGLFEFPEAVSHAISGGEYGDGYDHSWFIRSHAALGRPVDGRSRTGRLRQIAPNVYATGAFQSPSLVIAQADGAIVVGAPRGSDRTYELIETIKDQLGLRVTHVVLPHHNADHAAGIPAMAASGVTIVMHKLAEPYFRETVFPGLERDVDGLVAENVRILTVGDDASLIINDLDRPVTIHGLPGTPEDGMVLTQVGDIIYAAELVDPTGVIPERWPVLAAVAERVKELGLEVDDIVVPDGRSPDWLTEWWTLPGT